MCLTEVKISSFNPAFCSPRGASGVTEGALFTDAEFICCGFLQFAPDACKREPQPLVQTHGQHTVTHYIIPLVGQKNCFCTSQVVCVFHTKA